MTTARSYSSMQEQLHTDRGPHYLTDMGFVIMRPGPNNANDGDLN